MASLPPSTCFSAKSATVKPSPRSPLLAKTNTLNRRRSINVSCNAAANVDDKEKPNLIMPMKPPLVLDNQNIVDRRNMLLGLGAGGLYSTINFASPPSSFAAPISAPNIADCHEATSGIVDLSQAFRGTKCCPPNLNTPVKDFVFPSDKDVLRIRRPAQSITPEYVAKYNQAIQAMRDLPEDHPHSFVQQARIHCAYCNGAYTQHAPGSDDLKQLQIHNSWLFFPFHRWYLYFYERILGKLINDPTFALPFWNWDSPTGMVIPTMLQDQNVAPALFDEYRNASHLPPAVVDLDYNGRDKNASCVKQIGDNLGAMYKQMIRNAPDGLSFFGGVLRAGDNPIDESATSVGSVEAGCHTAIHIWTGSTKPNNEDMGNFYSAGYDPAFFVHHANVDRMWSIWKFLGGRRKDLEDPDWLNASFVFYDENKDLVRVYVKDSLLTSKLKYDYDRIDIPWLKSRPVARTKKSGAASKAKAAGKVKHVQDVKFPIKLDKIAKVLVKRPAKNRSKEEKEKEDELLLIDGIKFDSERFVKFDVYVNDEDDNASSAMESEFAGSFAQLPHSSGHKMMMKSALRLGLTELLEDLEAEDDESVLVTLVPRSGCEELTISNISIALVA